MAFRHTLKTGAGEESRTLDLNLGKVALYQLSYSRIVRPAREPGDEGRKYSGPFSPWPTRSNLAIRAVAADQDDAVPINA